MSKYSVDICQLRPATYRLSVKVLQLLSIMACLVISSIVIFFLISSWLFLDGYPCCLLLSRWSGWSLGRVSSCHKVNKFFGLYFPWARRVITLSISRVGQIFSSSKHSLVLGNRCQMVCHLDAGEGNNWCSARMDYAITSNAIDDSFNLP